MSNYKYFFLFLFLYNCSFSEENSVFNKHEMSIAIEPILKIYGGECDVIINRSSNEEDNHIKLEVKNSSLLDNDSNIFSICNSGIAYQFVKKSDDFINDFNNITVDAESNNVHIENVFNIKKVQEIIQYENKVANFINQLKNKNFDEISIQLDSCRIQFNKGNYLTNLIKIEEERSEIKGFEIMGFEVINSIENEQLLKFQGIIGREKENMDFSAFISLDNPDYGVVFFNYKW